MKNEPLLDLGGTLRTASAETTLRSGLEFTEQIGITRLANVTNLDAIGIPTWIAVRPLSKSLSVSQGKGATHELAKVSALMESIELYHAEEFVPHGPNKSIIDALERPDSFVDPLQLPLRQGASSLVHDEFEWTEATGLFSGIPRFVPRHMTCLDSTAVSHEARPFVSSSNGLASGNTLSEAALHATLELIERDQLSFWLAHMFNGARGSCTRVDPESVDSPICRRLISQLYDAGLEVAIWHITTTIQLPAFTCAIYDASGKTLFPQRASGHGCHILKEVALARAISEAAQSRLTHITGSRDDSGWLKYFEQLPSDSVVNHAWLHRIETEPSSLCYGAIAEHDHPTTTKHALETVQEELSRAGLQEILIVDLTQACFEIPVCQAFVPGLDWNATKDFYTPSSRMLEFLRAKGTME